MTEIEWKSIYVKRFLAGPWDEGDMTQDRDMMMTAASCADAAWEEDSAADPKDAATDELSEWHD